MSKLKWQIYLAAGDVMGERVLDVLFLSVSAELVVAGTMSVSTILERCAASGAVGK
jgi:hypothetical protein